MNPIRLENLSCKHMHLPFFALFITHLIRVIFGCDFFYRIKLRQDFRIGYGGLGVVFYERVLPSPYEGCSNVVGEAMGASFAVIVNSNYDTLRSLDEGARALLFKGVTVD
jgi:hypothetical protein